MKFDTPADDQSDRPIEGRRQRRPIASTVRSRPPARAPYAYEHHDVAPNRGLRLRRWLGDREGPHRFDGSDRAPKPRPACSRLSRRKTPASSARASTTPRSCSAARRSSTTTKRSRWSWRRPLSKRAPRRIWCASIMRRRQALSISPRPSKTAPAERRRSLGAAPPRAGRAISTGAFAAAPGEARCDLHHARSVARDDGAARVHRDVGRRQADHLDLQPDDRLGRGATSRRRSASRRKTCASISPYHRRRLWREAVPARRCPARRARARARRAVR